MSYGYDHVMVHSCRMGAIMSSFIVHRSSLINENWFLHHSCPPGCERTCLIGNVKGQCYLKSLLYSFPPSTASFPDLSHCRRQLPILTLFLSLNTSKVFTKAYIILIFLGKDFNKLKSGSGLISLSQFED